jgi:hypothetical protein
VTYDQAVNLFDIPMGKLFDISVAVRAFQIAMRAVKVEVLGNIQEPELSFLAALDVPAFVGNITESTIPVTEKAILLINRLRLTMKEEKAHQGEQKNCRGIASALALHQSYELI